MRRLPSARPRSTSSWCSMPSPRVRATKGPNSVAVQAGKCAQYQAIKALWPLSSCLLRGQILFHMQEMVCTTSANRPIGVPAQEADTEASPTCPRHLRPKLVAARVPHRFMAVIAAQQTSCSRGGSWRLRQV